MRAFTATGIGIHALPCVIQGAMVIGPKAGIISDRNTAEWHRPNGNRPAIRVGRGAVLPSIRGVESSSQLSQAASICKCQ